MSGLAVQPVALSAGAAVASAAPSPWIVSRSYDLAWFFGGALLSLAAVGLTVGAGVSMAAVYWVWLLLFDGPHIAAAFTRTYVDRAEWRARRGLLVGSVVLAYALGPLALLGNLVTGTGDPFLAYLGFAALYGAYHVVRQHYGFLALYKAAARDGSRLDFHLDRWALYAGCWAPYLWFLLSHPRARAMLALGSPQAGPLETALAVACGGVFAASLLTPLVRSWRRFGAGLLGRPQVGYLLLTNAIYGLTFFWLARYEPLYAASRGPDEDFLLLSVVTVVFHDVQYVGLVWWHNRNRYVVGGTSERVAAALEEFGPAASLNRTWLRYLGALGVFSLGYVVLACATGVFPHCTIFRPGPVLGPFTGTQIGLCLWWGLSLHHYILDQRIWRVRGDPVLKRNLGLAVGT